MSKIKYMLGIALAVLTLIFGAVYVYVTHYKPLAPENDTTITVWYANDSDLHDVKRLTDEYNSGAGADVGVNVNAVSFFNSETLYIAVKNAISKGAEMPAAVICDADFAASLEKSGALGSMELFFDEWEASEFDGLMSTGCRGEKGILSVPLAATANVLVVNKELAGDASEYYVIEDLCAKAADYYEKSGSSFFTITDYPFFFRNAMIQLGDEFDGINPHDTDNSNCKYIYKILAETAYDRGLTAVEGSAVQLVANGKLACAIVPSRELAENGDAVDLDKIAVCPCPVMKNGHRACAQDITAITILKCDSDSEIAAAAYINWLTDDEVNPRLVKSGAVPANGSAVAKDELSSAINTAIEKTRNVKSGNTCTANADYLKNKEKFSIAMQNIMNSMK